MEVLKTEEIAPTKRKVTLKIEPEDLVSEAEEAYAALEKEAEIPGFRKGHVPRKFLEYRFQDEIRESAFKEAIDKAIKDFSEEGKFLPIGAPDFSEEDFKEAVEKVVEGPVEFSFVLEGIPEFELPSYQDREFEVPEPRLTVEEMVNEHLRSVQEKDAIYIAIDDRPAREGDYLVVDTQATREGKEFPAFTLKKAFLDDLCGGKRLEAFDRAFVGRRKGERFEFDIQLDKEHPLYEEGIDNTVHVSARIYQISEKDLPELDDEFARDHGFESLEEFRNHIRGRLTEIRDEMLERAKVDKVMDYLLDNTELAVPATMIQTRYQIMQAIRRREARLSGESEEDLFSDERARVEQDTMFSAEMSVKRELILDKIAKEQEITVSDDEYYEAMQKVMENEGGENLDRFLADIDRRGLEETYRDQIRERKTIRWLVEQNRFKIQKNGDKEEEET